MYNAGGYIQLSRSISRYDFNDNVWVPHESGRIDLDENGASNELWKCAGDESVNANIYGADNEVIRNVRLPAWNDATWDSTVAQVRASISVWRDKRKMQKVRCDKVDENSVDMADITEMTGLIMVINDRSAGYGYNNIKFNRGLTSTGQVDTVKAKIYLGCIAVFIGYKINGKTIQYSLQ